MNSPYANFARGAGLVLSLSLVLPSSSLAQGYFLFRNPDAPTHIGSLDGPLAGSNVYAQALVGVTADNLVPVGSPTFHLQGFVFGVGVTVPFAAPGSFVEVQMAAWDETLWGANFATVPTGQLGLTDIVRVWLTDPVQQPDWPSFTQSAIVPVPEPSVFALILVAGSAAAAWHLRRHHRRGPLLEEVPLGFGTPAAWRRDKNRIKFGAAPWWLPDLNFHCTRGRRHAAQGLRSFV